MSFKFAVGTSILYCPQPFAGHARPHARTPGVILRQPALASGEVYVALQSGHILLVPERDLVLADPSPAPEAAEAEVIGDEVPERSAQQCRNLCSH